MDKELEISIDDEIRHYTSMRMLVRCYMENIQKKKKGIPAVESFEQMMENIKADDEVLFGYDINDARYGKICHYFMLFFIQSCLDNLEDSNEDTIIYNAVIEAAKKMPFMKNRDIEDIFWFKFRKQCLHAWKMLDCLENSGFTPTIDFIKTHLKKDESVSTCLDTPMQKMVDDTEKYGFAMLEYFMLKRSRGLEKFNDARSRQRLSEECEQVVRESKKDLRDLDLWSPTATLMFLLIYKNHTSMNDYGVSRLCSLHGPFELSSMIKVVIVWCFTVRVDNMVECLFKNLSPGCVWDYGVRLNDLYEKYHQENNKYLRLYNQCYRFRDAKLRCMVDFFLKKVGDGLSKQSYKLKIALYFASRLEDSETRDLRCHMWLTERPLYGRLPFSLGKLFDSVASNTSQRAAVAIRGTNNQVSVSQRVVDTRGIGAGIAAAAAIGTVGYVYNQERERESRATLAREVAAARPLPTPSSEPQQSQSADTEAVSSLAGSSSASRSSPR